jgi:hypothetical protein
LTISISPLGLLAFSLCLLGPSGNSSNSFVFGWLPRRLEGFPPWEGVGASQEQEALWSFRRLLALIIELAKEGLGNRTGL